ncbi:MAG: hypothetical protein M9892_05650 [Bacteroidetes bacterium]|nr:hypothetical protein [Bacteroidota bacterium]
MKNLLHIIAAYFVLLASFSLKAQTPPGSRANLKEIMDWIYAPIDNSQYISTGLLMDKGMMDSSFFLAYRPMAHRQQKPCRRFVFCPNNNK